MIYRRSCKKCNEWDAEHAKAMREDADICAPMACQQCRRFFPDMFRPKEPEE